MTYKVKRYLYYVLLILHSSFLIPLAFADTPADWPDPKDMTFDDVDFTPPEPTRLKLPNGITLYIAEDRSLPLISGVAYFKASALLDPEDKVGLAELTATMLREGGAGDLSPDEMDIQLETLAASIEASADTNLATVGFSSLTETIDNVLPLWFDTMTRPTFDERRLEVERGGLLEGIRRENDDPSAIASREFFSRIAAGHPFGYYATEETINAITQDDLAEFHSTYYQPQAMTVAITGDFDTAEMIEKIETLLAGWEGQEVDYPELPEFNLRPEPTVYLVPKELEQSVILVGHPSVYAYSPEYNDLTVANDILGAGGFSSRLFLEVRTKRGLAYSTGSGLSQGFSQPGVFYMSAATRVDKTAETVGLLISEAKRLQESGITDTELERSRSSIVNASLFRFTSVAAITQRAARVQLLGLEPGYYETYLERVQSMTKDDVQSIVQQELRPDDFVVLVVGDPAKFDAPLDEFGNVVTIELEASEEE
ncbi:MAG: M16 family metallopeptidase [Trueperaceae bacterium]